VNEGGRRTNRHRINSVWGAAGGTGSVNDLPSLIPNLYSLLCDWHRHIAALWSCLWHIPPYVKPSNHTIRTLSNFALCPHRLYLCVLCWSQQIAIVSLTSISWSRRSSVGTVTELQADSWQEPEICPFARTTGLAAAPTVVLCGWGVRLTFQLHLGPKFGMSGAVPPLYLSHGATSPFLVSSVHWLGVIAQIQWVYCAVQAGTINLYV